MHHEMSEMRAVGKAMFKEISHQRKGRLDSGVLWATPASIARAVGLKYVTVVAWFRDGRITEGVHRSAPNGTRGHLYIHPDTAAKIIETYKKTGKPC